MSAWGTTDSAPEPAAPPPAAGEGGINPREHGWVEKQAYDYATFNKSSKDQQADLEAMGVATGGWASNAEIYNWDDDYGDVGPAMPELEKMLFGGEHRMQAGIKFEE